jgi:hypothetical protein
MFKPPMVNRRVRTLYHPLRVLAQVQLLPQQVLRRLSREAVPPQRSLLWLVSLRLLLLLLRQDRVLLGVALTQLHRRAVEIARMEAWSLRVVRPGRLLRLPLWQLYRVP